MLGSIGKEKIEGIAPQPLKELRERYETLPDKRYAPFVEHKLADIVMITLLAVMADADEGEKIGEFARVKEGWLRGFLELKQGIPSHDTIQRVMAQIDGTVLYSLTINFLRVKIESLSFIAWKLRLKVEGGKDEGAKAPHIVAFDGKESRGSKRAKTDRDAVPGMQTVSAYSTEYGLCLGEAVIEEKTNEIPTIQAMLDAISVEGCIATWDALNTQKETVKKVIQKKGDYVGALKGNQHAFYEDVKSYFEDSQTEKELRAKPECYLKTVDKEQSGIATREYYLTDDIWWLEPRKQWAGLKAIGYVRRTLVKNSGETSVEPRCFISSVTDITNFSQAVRLHWGVENKIHCPLDYTFLDDQHTTMEKHGAQNLQTMKRTALAILGLVQTFYSGISIRKIRYILSLDFDKQIEQVFRLLNVDALHALLLPKPSD
jgi:predicted transposase YbfD/YdcC